MSPDSTSRWIWKTCRFDKSPVFPSPIPSKTCKNGYHDSTIPRWNHSQSGPGNGSNGEGLVHSQGLHRDGSVLQASYGGNSFIHSDAIPYYTYICKWILYIDCNIVQIFTLLNAGIGTNPINNLMMDIGLCRFYLYRQSSNIPTTICAPQFANVDESAAMPHLCAWCSLAFCQMVPTCANMAITFDWSAFSSFCFTAIENRNVLKQAAKSRLSCKRKFGLLLLLQGWKSRVSHEATQILHTWNLAKKSSCIKFQNPLNTRCGRLLADRYLPSRMLSLDGQYQCAPGKGRNNVFIKFSIQWPKKHFHLFCFSPCLRFLLTPQKSKLPCRISLNIFLGSPRANYRNFEIMDHLKFEINKSEHDHHEFPAPEVIDLSNHISFLWRKCGETGKCARSTVAHTVANTVALNSGKHRNGMKTLANLWTLSGNLVLAMITSKDPVSACYEQIEQSKTKTPRNSQSNSGLFSCDGVMIRMSQTQSHTRSRTLSALYGFFWFQSSATIPCSHEFVQILVT